MLKNRYVLGAIVVAVLFAGYWLLRPTLPPVREQARVAERKATVWNRLAMVREPLATLHYGDGVGIVESKQWNGVEYARVIALGKSVGWMESKQLMPEALWDRAADNLKKSRAMKPQARGITKVPTNVRVEPGRTSQRFFQLSRDAPVEIFSRAVVELPPESAAPKKEESAGEVPAEPRREDWVFIRGQDPDAGDLAGWVLARFLEPDLPAPLRDYAAGIRFVAWFELSHVPAGLPERVEKEKARGVAQGRSEGMPQYLAAGAVGPEGQICDFTLLRFYTWHATRHRYETAYVESGLCGRLPIRVTPIPTGANLDKSEAAFSFTALSFKGFILPNEGLIHSEASHETREYRMKQNIIRRLRAKK